MGSVAGRRGKGSGWNKGGERQRVGSDELLSNGVGGERTSAQGAGRFDAAKRGSIAQDVERAANAPFGGCQARRSLGYNVNVGRRQAAEGSSTALLRLPDRDSTASSSVRGTLLLL